MRLNAAEPHRIDVSVSRRNLLALLGKLANPHSARTITMQCEHPRKGEHGPVLLAIHGESDIEHYADRSDNGGPILQAADVVMQTAIDLIEQVQDSAHISDFDDTAFDKALHQLAYLRERVATQSAIVV
jgi:hypothetical protein